MAHLILKLSTTILVILCLPITMATDGDLVLDADGNPLEVGSSYIIRTLVSQSKIGGGVVVASKQNQPQYPEYVAHLDIGFENEVPVMFYPSNPSHKNIYVSSNIYIVSNTTSSGCPQGAWQLSPDANSGKVFISTGGIIGNPTTQSFFKIIYDYSDYFYRLVYCPSSSTNNIMCSEVNTIDFTEEFELGWLGLSAFRDSYFAVLRFIKV